MSDDRYGGIRTPLVENRLCAAARSLERGEQ
jgi:hypothetical protein